MYKVLLIAPHDYCSFIENSIDLSYLATQLDTALQTLSMLCSHGQHCSHDQIHKITRSNYIGLVLLAYVQYSKIKEELALLASNFEVL